jgi:hypothetical protein
VVKPERYSFAIVLKWKWVQLCVLACVANDNGDRS